MACGRAVHVADSAICAPRESAPALIEVRDPPVRPAFYYFGPSKPFIPEDWR